MSDLIPYFAGLIMILFGVAFYLALQGFKKLDQDSSVPPDKDK